MDFTQNRTLQLFYWGRKQQSRQQSSADRFYHTDMSKIWSYARMQRHLGSYFLNIPKAFMTFIPNSELSLLVENLEPLNSRVAVYFSCNSVSSNWSNLRSNITTNFKQCRNRTTKEGRCKTNLCYFCLPPFLFLKHLKTLVYIIK